jgi:quercetin dioxygenase-like cupin family protein
MTMMKRISNVVLALSASLSCLSTPCFSNDVHDDQGLAKLELEWANAVERNDVDAIGRFLHPDFTFTSPTGAIANRSEHLEDFRNGNSRFPLVALSEVEIRVYGPLAVITLRPTITGTVRVNGNVITLKCQGARWTDSMILRDGSWTCVARQQSNIPAAPTTATTVIEKLLKEKIDGKEAKLTVMEWAYAPGASTPPHRHHGPVAVYVLEGAIESQIEGSPLMTYRRGDAFFEPAEGRHLISRNASQVMPARFLAYFLTPKDAPPIAIQTESQEHKPSGWATEGHR